MVVEAGAGAARDACQRWRRASRCKSRARPPRATRYRPSAGTPRQAGRRMSPECAPRPRDPKGSCDADLLRILAVSTHTAVTLLAACATTPSSGPMSFFITSAGIGKGADLGGLAGADAHCQKLGAAAGAGPKTWRAYLSVPGTFPSATAPAVPAGSMRATASATARGSTRRAQCRARPRPSAQRQQHLEDDRADREGRTGEGPRRHAERARHPDRLARRWHRACAADRTRPAAPGPRAATARRWSVITTGAGRRPTTGRRRGTSPTCPPAAARKRWSAPAAPGGSTASRGK